MVPIPQAGRQGSPAPVCVLKGEKRKTQGKSRGGDGQEHSVGKTPPNDTQEKASKGLVERKNTEEKENDGLKEG